MILALLRCKAVAVILPGVRQFCRCSVVVQCVPILQIRTTPTVFFGRLFIFSGIVDLAKAQKTVGPDFFYFWPLLRLRAQNVLEMTQSLKKNSSFSFLARILICSECTCLIMLERNFDLGPHFELPSRNSPKLENRTTRAVFQVFSYCQGLLIYPRPKRFSDQNVDLWAHFGAVGPENSGKKPQWSKILEIEH